jgi:hypothetical protein
MNISNGLPELGRLHAHSPAADEAPPTPESMPNGYGGYAPAWPLSFTAPPTPSEVAAAARAEQMKVRAMNARLYLERGEGAVMSKILREYSHLDYLDIRRLCREIADDARVLLLAEQRTPLARLLAEERTETIAPSASASARARELMVADKSLGFSEAHAQAVREIRGGEAPPRFIDMVVNARPEAK